MLSRRLLVPFLVLLSAADASGVVRAIVVKSAPVGRRSVAVRPTAQRAPSGAARAIAAPAAQVGLPAPNFPYAAAADDEPLESRWSWRAPLDARGAFEARLGCGLDARGNGPFVRVVAKATGPVMVEMWNRHDNKCAPLTAATPLLAKQGELGLQRVGPTLRVLFDRVVVADAAVSAPTDGRFRVGLTGAAQWTPGEVQPTEAVSFGDDFMRLGTATSNAVDWQPTGLWKTSGTLGPKSDPLLNPNPFVYRADLPVGGPGVVEDISRIGTWFWSDYAITASVKPQLGAPAQPLVAGLWAYCGPSSATSPASDSGALRAEVDFRTGVATLRRGTTVLAQSAPFNAQPNQWHRLTLEPGPGQVRFLFDGVEVLTAKGTLAQGPAALYAHLGTGNLADFDDVHVGLPGATGAWGEPPLPDRFTKDRLMKFWASNALAWSRDSSGTWWNSGDFFGPATVTVPLPVLAEGDGLALVRTTPGTGFLERVTLKYTGADTWSAQVQNRDSAVPQHLSFKAPSGTLTYSTGSATVVKLGDRVVYQVRTPGSPALYGTRIGVEPLKQGQPVPEPPLEKITLSSGTVKEDGRVVIGVSITPVTPEVAKGVGLQVAAGAIVDALTAKSPAEKAGLLVGDVIVGMDGKPVPDVDALREAVSAHQPGSDLLVQVLRRSVDPLHLNWDAVDATTPQRLDYAFTTAPVDWRAGKGQWQVSERWTCSPQWSFFAGTDDDNPTLWSRFATHGDTTWQAYVATPMDLARGERTPTDLCLTVDGDGSDLASGYSFLFSAKNHAVNQIRRGDAVVWERPFVMPPGAGDTHQDWFYVRIEQRSTPQGLHFTYTVNGKELASYTDPHPLSLGGHLALWTVRGSLSVARVRVWYSALGAPVLPPLAPLAPLAPIRNVLGDWSTRLGPDGSPATRLVSLEGPAPRVLEIVNPQSGGDWTTYVTRTAYDPRVHPTLQFDYKVGPGVKINLYAKIEDRWREIGFTGPAAAAPNGDQNVLGAVANVHTDDAWHHAEFDVLAAMRERGIPETQVQALAFAAPDSDYLPAGLGGNHLGATFSLRNFAAPVPE